MSVRVTVQYALPRRGVPAPQSFRRWVAAVLAGRCKRAEVVVRVVDADESAELNETYRRKKGPTNVLSFPFEMPAGLEVPLLGDIVICAPVVAREALEQGKEGRAHWAHMTVHGVLHLLGYDHLDDDQARVMEGLEREILAKLGYPDPYGEMNPV